MDKDQLENPVLGYVVIAAALVAGMLSATVFGESPGASKSRNTGTIPAIVDDGLSPAPTTRAEDARKLQPAAEPEIVESDFSARRWILGVRSRSTSAGCVITSVVEFSAAEQAGFSVGDVIIAVDGNQVGWVGGSHRPLHDLIDAARSRHARVLVQRSGSGVIETRRVRLRTMGECLGH